MPAATKTERNIAQPLDILRITELTIEKTTNTIHISLYLSPEAWVKHNYTASNYISIGKATARRHAVKVNHNIVQFRAC